MRGNVNDFEIFQRLRLESSFRCSRAKKQGRVFTHNLADGEDLLTRLRQVIKSSAECIRQTALKLLWNSPWFLKL